MYKRKKNGQSSLEKEMPQLNLYKRKFARLLSLTEQIKRYQLPMVNHWLEIEKTEAILCRPDIANRDWTLENPHVQKSLCSFLNIHIAVYEKALNLLGKN